MEGAMNRAIIVTAVLLSGVIGVQAAAARPRHHAAHVPSCLARQRAMLTPLDGYGGYLPSNAPALMQQIIHPMLDVIRTRCLPEYHGPLQYQWNAATGSYELE
jgi:hypothetical protein